MKWFLALGVLLAGVCSTLAGGCEYMWGPWGDCSNTCGDGVMKRYRECPSYCNDCSGYLPKEETKTCNEGDCCNWNDWGQWGDCSKTCGNGYKKRTRTCPQYCKCYGPDEETKSCNEGECCYWEAWGNWGDCSESCGYGTKKRYRVCKYQTSYCQCPGKNYETMACEDHKWGYWGPWGSWSKCAGKKCIKGRKRECKYYYDECDCKGDNKYETAKCDPKECCKTKWGKWGKWSSCDNCQQKQSRSKKCKWAKKYCKKLGKPVCDPPQPKQERDCPNYNPWSNWSDCVEVSQYPQKCGQERTRECTGEKETRYCECPVYPP